MLVYPQLDRVVLYLELFIAVGVEGFVNRVLRIEIPVLEALGISDRADSRGRNDNALASEHHLHCQRVEGHIQCFQRVHAVGIEADAQRAVVVEVVGHAGSEIHEQAKLEVLERNRIGKSFPQLCER